MRKNLTKKLFLSILTLAFAVVSLGASTYAWFTMSREANVDKFTGKVSSTESGLEICATSLDVTTANVADSAWQTTALDLFAADQLGPDYLENLALAPVQNKGKAKTFAAAFETITDAHTFADATANTHYIAFRLHFRLTQGAEQTDKTVLLSDYTLATDSTPSKWYVNHKYNVSATNEVPLGELSNLYYVSDAARIGIKGTENTYVLETPTLSGTGDFATYGISTYGAWDYYKKVNSITNDDLFPTDYLESSFTNNFTSAQPVCTLNSANSYSGSIDVYVWIDGWDAECINAIFTQVLSATFKFTLSA